MEEEKLEYTKFRERLEWAKKLLKEEFGIVQNPLLIHEAVEIAKTLFVRSEIAYSGKKF